MFAGVLGVIIAVWLQLVRTRRCPPEYIFLFMGLGSGLMLVNHSAGGWSIAGSAWLPLLGNVLLMLTEVVAFRRVLRESSVDVPDKVTIPGINEE